MCTATNTRRFETQTCGRCGGGGQFSYCEMYGSTCFKCGGKGRVYTKRGYAALQFYINSCMVAIRDLRRGDRIIDCTGAVRVVDSVFESNTKRLEGAKWIPYVEVRCGNFGWCAVSYDDKVRRSPLPEEQARLLAAAYDYQDTLTKAGKPRKQGASR